ncbi:MAG: hypothetical protein JXA33_03690 [Anaerolineae bacterium]|nr:hypothetical protein [Anaerolineae bacterium]
MEIKPIKEKSAYVIGVSILLLFLTISIAWNTSKSKTTRELNEETVVVSAHSDPYFSLAQQISQEENLRIVEEFTDILQFSPKYIIWVASPSNLTIEKLANIGNTFKSQDYYPALGIISGSTLDIAERLWERRNSAQAGNNFIGGDVEILQLIYEPTIFNISDGANTKIALNKISLIESLKQADYFYWTRHSGASTWYWNDGSENWSENDELSSEEIPQLKPVVIYSPTCSSFRPWSKDSMALGFIDKGAVAFLGFTNSPHTTAFSKYGLSVPGLTSWKEFPLGLVAQIQNKTTTSIIYNSPQFFMLGDPRIYLSKTQPYQIVSDQIVKNGKRVIVGHSDKNDVLAVKIDNAAGYHFLSIKELTSLSENDIFYNNKVQTLDLGADKYILMLHKGGDFQIELSPNTPFGWVLVDAIVDALDYSWVALWVNVYADSNPYIYIVSIPIFMSILLFKIFKQRKSIKEYQKILVIAFFLALFRLTYCLLRSDEYTVSANLVDYTFKDMVIGFAGVFSSGAGGLMLLRDSRKIVVKSLGLLFAVARQFWMAGFYLGFLTLLNNVPQVTKMTVAGVWNYTVFWLSFIPLMVEVLIILSTHQYITSDFRLNNRELNA